MTVLTVGILAVAYSVVTDWTRNSFSQRLMGIVALGASSCLAARYHKVGTQSRRTGNGKPIA